MERAQQMQTEQNRTRLVQSKPRPQVRKNHITPELKELELYILALLRS